MKILIKITKNILEKSKNCNPKYCEVTKNCAIALAIIDILPDVEVSFVEIYVPYSYEIEKCIRIPIPIEATKFIREFDRLKDFPEKRMLMPEFSFEIEVPIEIIEKIGISDVYKILSESKTLELVSI